jgi:hypothetical protein
MKPKITNQEILLSTSASFTKREWCRLDAQHTRSKMSSYSEELERACWAGILFETLPELMASSSPDSKMFIWNIRSAFHFLLISRGTDPCPTEYNYSIDPHLFLTAANFD